MNGLNSETTNPREEWHFVTTLCDREAFRVKNLNLWDYKWNLVTPRVEVTDPHYKQKFYFNEFQISDGKTTVNFVAGEFSNTIFGIYLRESHN